MAETNDWRLTGQERYLSGKTLHQAKWTSDQQNWDHDHCAFCWAKFMGDVPTSNTDVLLAGYVTEDGRHWICKECFNDFREQFEWKVEEEQPHESGGPAS